MATFRSHRHHLPNDVELLSLESPSSNATASDIPGPGRVLGNVFSFLGKRLERAMESFAMRRGYGPQNVARRIRERLDTYQPWHHRSLENIQISRNYDKKNLEKDLRQLIRYAW